MLKVLSNPHFAGGTSLHFNAGSAEEARSFHRRIPGYEATPLVSLSALAQQLGVRAIYVKDESNRFGLKAFKVLGGSFALGKILANKLGVSLDSIDLQSAAASLDAPLTLTTATAGNHGTGVAWAARQMGLKAVVYMPKGSAASSVDRIEKLGATCIVTDVNYDDTVRLASQAADSEGWTLVQDTAWSGYEAIPTWISQGYMTMASEAVEQMALVQDAPPSHVMLQAGVGAMAGGVLGLLNDVYGAHGFSSLVSEPAAADCLFQSIQADDGNLVRVTGALDSIMAGLACGEVNPVTWDILKNRANAFATVSDDVAATGMRILGNPLPGDPAIVSGESGAINVGLLYLLMTSNSAASSNAKAALGLDRESTILIFSTEGDTNPSRYRDIVWEGRLPLQPLGDS